MRLLLWRHGRTGWNAERRFQGQTDVDLDEVGRAQAAAAAPRLAARNPRLIISSDLRRAVETARPLVELTGLPLRQDARLRERHFGPWQGMTSAEIQARYPDDYLRWGSGSPVVNPEVEPVEAVTERVVGALRDAVAELAALTVPAMAGAPAGASPPSTAPVGWDETDEDVVVIVTHGGAARVGAGALLGWPPEIWHTLSALHNCQVTELRLTSGRGWQLEAHNTH